MRVFRRLRNLVTGVFDSLLINKNFRYYYARMRFYYFYVLLKKIQVHPDFQDSINLKYNMNFEPMAFGSLQRMSLLLNPALGFLYPNPETSDVLIVAPRTEDDIIWARALGMKKAIGLDIFSYSPLIKVGNAHQVDEIGDSSFDLILIGWLLPYIEDPAKVVSEMLRICKKMV